jgi:hypothetical protein
LRLVAQPDQGRLRPGALRGKKAQAALQGGQHFAACEVLVENTASAVLPGDPGHLLPGAAGDNQHIRNASRLVGGDDLSQHRPVTPGQQHLWLSHPFRFTCGKDEG